MSAGPPAHPGMGKPVICANYLPEVGYLVTYESIAR